MRKGVSVRANRRIRNFAFLILAALLVTGIFQYWNYANIAGTRVPIMDYWRWIANYGPGFHDGSIGFWELVRDTNEQVQPVSTYISFSILNFCDFDVWILVALGVGMHCLTVAAVAIAFFFRKRSGGKQLWFCRLFACAAIVSSLLNYNQWELRMLPFSLGSSIRIGLYLLLFALGSNIFVKLLRRPFFVQAVSVMFLSIASMAVSLTISGAYMAAYIGAISICGLLVIVRKWKQLNPLHSLHAVSWGGAVILTLYLYLRSATMGSGGSFSLTGTLKGLLVYLGAALVPHPVSEVTLQPFLIAGGAFLAVAALAVFLYLRRGLDRKSLFPLLCLLYSVLNGLVISYGRVGGYGVSVAASSRYTVESVIGVVGLIWMIAMLAEAPKRNWYRRAACIGLSAAVVGLCAWCYTEEMQIAPYRKNYNDGIESIMRNIDFVKDSEMGNAQESPAYVRKAVDFLRSNELSIFADLPEETPVYSYAEASARSGCYSDGFLSSDATVYLWSRESGLFSLTGYYPKQPSGNETVQVYVNNELAVAHTITSQVFTFEIPAPAGRKVCLQFLSPFDCKAADSPDVRNLAFLLTDLHAVE